MPLTRILSFIVFCFSPVIVFGQSTLSITMRNVKSDKGVCSIGLYADAASFPNCYQKAIKSVVVKAHKGVVKVQFDHVPKGTYAVAVIHDENGDGKLNTNIIGIPKEGYGASNNKLPYTSAPKFSESCFTVNGEDKDVAIDLRYSLF